MVFLSNAYIKNLHKWQCNDNFIAGRFGYVIPPIFTSGNINNEEDYVDEKMATPPNTISGKDVTKLLVWLNALSTRHDLDILGSAVSPQPVFKTNGTFKWQVLDGNGNFNILFEGGDDTIIGYSWGTATIWNQLRRAIKHLCMSVNIVPPHEIAEIVDEEEVSNGIPIEYWWEKDIQIRDSRWLTEENRVELGLLMPPYSSNPLALKGFPAELHLMADQTLGVYGDIGQYGVTNPEEYMQYYKRPEGYKKADFFNFTLSKSGHYDIRVRQFIEPSGCNICNTIYKYVTWYRKEFESSAIGNFTYLPTHRSRYTIPMAVGPGYIPDYDTYDFESPAMSYWYPTLNTPVICTDKENRFQLPDVWYFGPAIYKWVTYSTQHIGPKCYFNNDLVWWDAGGCIGCANAYTIPWYCGLPFISLGPSCATWLPYACPFPRLYLAPETVNKWFVTAVADPSTTQQTDLSTAINFDGGNYWISLGGYSLGGGPNINVSQGSYAQYVSSKNTQVGGELDHLPNATIDKQHSFYDMCAYTGNGGIVNGTYYEFREHSYYTNPITTQQFKNNLKRNIFYSLQDRAVIPSNQLQAPEIITTEWDSCDARWIGTAWASSWIKQCYDIPCTHPEGPDCPEGGFWIPPWVLYFNDIVNNEYGLAHDATAPINDNEENTPSPVWNPFINGLWGCQEKVLDDIPTNIWLIGWPYQPKLYHQINKGFYGTLLSETVDSITVGDYLNQENVLIQQFQYNINNPNNTGYINLGTQSPLVGDSFFTPYSTNTLQIYNKTLNYDKQDRFKRFPAESSRWEFTLDHSDYGWKRFEVANDGEIIWGDDIDINQISNIIQSGLQEIYDDQEYEYLDARTGDGYPVSSYMRTMSKVRGSPASYGDDGVYTYEDGFQSYPKKCTASIDIHSDFTQKIHVCATYLSAKNMKNKFGLQLVGETFDEESGESTGSQSVYRGKILFGHGSRPMMEGVGAFPTDRPYEHGWKLSNSDTLELNDIRSFVHYYPLDYWIGDLKIVWGYTHLDEYDYETDTWIHKLPDNTNQTELYKLVGKRVGKVLDGVSGYGAILGSKKLTGKPTRIDASDGTITMGQIVDFSIDMSDIIYEEANLNGVFFIAHFIDNRQQTANGTAKFKVPKPYYHWQGAPIDNEETIFFHEDNQVYGVYADVFENVNHYEVTSTSVDIPTDTDGDNVADATQTIKTKQLNFIPYKYNADVNWFGTPSGYYPDYVVSSRKLTFGNATNATIPYQGRFGNIVTWIGSGVSQGFESELSNIHRPQPHVAFKIMEPLYKVGDGSAGGNKDGNETRFIKDNDQKTPPDLINSA